MNQRQSTLGKWIFSTVTGSSLILFLILAFVFYCTSFREQVTLSHLFLLLFFLLISGFGFIGVLYCNTISFLFKKGLISEKTRKSISQTIEHKKGGKR